MKELLKSQRFDFQLRQAFAKGKCFLVVPSNRLRIMVNQYVPFPSTLSTSACATEHKKIHELGENFMMDFSLSSNIGSIGGMYNIESDFLELKRTSGFKSVDGHVEPIKCKDDTMRRAFN